MFECPIDFFKDNLIFNKDKSCWAAFKIKGYDYDYLSDEAKIQVFNSLTLFLSNIVSEAKILIIPVQQSLKENFELLKKNLYKEDSLFEFASYQIEDVESYLEQKAAVSGNKNDYETYLFVKLVKDDEIELVSQLKDAYQFIISAVMNDINAFMNIDTRDILKTKLTEFEKLANEFFISQRKRIDLEKVNVKTIQWMLRKMTFRGLSDPKLFYKTETEDWQPESETVTVAKKEYIRPKQLFNLFSGSIYRESRYLRIEHTSGVSYQTFLPITGIPEESIFPGNEWIYMLQQDNTQVEVCIHIQALEHRESLKQIEYKKRAIDSQTEHIAEADAEIPEDLLEGKEQAGLLEAELKSGHFPLLRTSVVICVADSNLERMEKKANEIKEMYEDMHFVIERPMADQFELFTQFIPSVSFCIQDFVIKLPPSALAAGIIGASRELGDKTGAYIGHTGEEQKNVFLNMSLACLTNKSASTTFYGNLGTGKSFNANLLIYTHIIMYGAYGLIFDPKGERSHWVKDLKILNGKINLVTLSAEKKFKGMLDPFNVFKNDFEEAAELAINLLSEMFKLQPKDLEYTALLAALDIMKSDTSCVPSMLRMADILKNFPKEDQLKKPANLLARQISLLRNSGMSSLLIGDGSEQTINLDNRLNILQIQNLKLPSPDTPKEDYTREENLSNTLMMVLSSFAKKFIHSFPGRFKLALIDESWMLSKTTAGVSLMDYFARMGRSLFCGLILNGHSVLDLPSEAIRNTITYKFCFRTDNTAEVERMLKYLNLEITKENVNMIHTLENAQCVFRDLNGRVGLLKFDAVFQDIIDIFSTTPGKEKKPENPSILNSFDDTDHTEIEMQDQDIKKESIPEIDIYSLEEVI